MARPRIRVSEADVLVSVFAYLRMHPKVAWIKRVNTGATKIEGRFMRFGFLGCSDIIGQLKDGRFLAVECKSSVGKPTEPQTDFLELVRSTGGLAGIARSIDDAEKLLIAPLRCWA